MENDVTSIYYLHVTKIDIFLGKIFSFLLHCIGYCTPKSDACTFLNTLEASIICTSRGRYEGCYHFSFIRFIMCCCSLPCNHCSIRPWVVEEILAFLVVGCVLRIFLSFHHISQLSYSDGKIIR